MRGFSTGRWITLKEAADVRPIHVFHRQLEKADLPEPLEKNLHVLFRARFTPRGDAPVTLRFSADDYAKVYLNGALLTQGPAPGFSFHYYYMQIDLTPHLREGENVLAFHTYYQGLINRVWVSGDGQHGLIYDVTQGGRVLDASGEHTRCARHTGYAACGECGYHTQFLERYDAAAPEAHFAEPAFDDSGWPGAALRRHESYTLVPQPTRPLTYERIHPTVWEKRENGWFADFGAVYVGTPELSARGPAGAELWLRAGQELNEDGSVRFDMRCNCRYEDCFVLSGGEDTLDAYDYKSFRYLEIIAPEGVTVSRPALLARHYPFTLKAACREEDPRLRAIWDLCVNSLKYGAQEVLQDCMDREKGQYLGDGTFTSAAYSVLTGDTALLDKLLDDALRTAFINEGLMTCSPCAMMQEIAEYSLMVPFLMLIRHRLTRDLSFLRARYAAAARVLDFFRESYARKDGLLKDLDKWCVVDWPQEARDGYDFDLTEGRVAVGCHNAVNAYYLGAVRYLNRIAALCGFAPYADETPLLAAYTAAFYDEDRHLFTDTEESRHASLASNALPLWFGLCPDAEAEANARAMVLTKPASHSAFFITFAGLCGLTRLGDTAGVRALLTDEGRWLRMLREGATNTFEAWGKDAKWNTSLNHLCYSYAVLFLTDWGLEDMLAG